MKNLTYIIAALMSVVFLSACSNTDQDPISPNVPQFEKIGASEIAYPFNLHQTFPELNTSTISWEAEKEGILITVNEITKTSSDRYLFATLEYSSNKSFVMAFLGNSKYGQYYLNGMNAKDVARINVFYYDAASTTKLPVPYSESTVFKNLGVKGWSDAGNMVKIKSYTFTAGMEHLFAQLIGSEGSKLMFLGRPYSEDFDFPKSEKLTLKDIKLFTYTK